MTNKQHERILILSGGAARGIYQVGALKALAEHGYRWDAIAGVSVGSINAFFLSHYKKEDQYKAILELEKLWKTEIANSKCIYKPWSYSGVLNYAIAFKKSGVFNTEPLKHLLEKHFNPTNLISSGVKLFIGTFSISAGKYVSKSGNDIKNIIDWIMASSSYPFAFPPIKIDGELYTDGGIRNYLPVFDILECCNPKQIDIILTKPIAQPVYKKPSEINNLVKFGVRILDTFSTTKDPLKQIKTTCNEKNINLDVFGPKDYLKYNNKIIESLDFDPIKMNCLFDQGYKDTIEYLNNKGSLNASV